MHFKTEQEQQDLNLQARLKNRDLNEEEEKAMSEVESQMEEYYDEENEAEEEANSRNQTVVGGTGTSNAFNPKPEQQ